MKEHQTHIEAKAAAEPRGARLWVALHVVATMIFVLIVAVRMAQAVPAGTVTMDAAPPQAAATDREAVR